MLGENIAHLRKENKISQEQIAEKLDVSGQNVGLWENGHATPSMDNIITIANILEVSTDVLLKDDVEENANSESVNNKKSRKNGMFVVLFSIVIVALVALSIFIISQIYDRKLSAEEVFDLIAPCTVEINGEGVAFSSTGTGSFIDDNGTIVTNYHVIESCLSINVTTIDGDIHTVESILGVDKDRDIAILKINYQNKSFVKIKNDEIRTGEKVYTLGSSLGLTGTFSEGIISSSSREIDGYEFIQITAPISSGNSGGPLVDEYGNVIGITTGAFTEGQNLNLAIPIETIYQIDRSKKYSVNELFLIYRNYSNSDIPRYDAITGEPLIEQHKKSNGEVYMYYSYSDKEIAKKYIQYLKDNGFKGNGRIKSFGPEYNVVSPGGEKFSFAVSLEQNEVRVVLK